MTKVTQCVLLGSHRPELYWNGDVCGSDAAENVLVSVTGQVRHHHTWEEPEEWDRGCVYEAKKQKITLFSEECLYPYDTDKISVSFSDGVIGADDGPVEKSFSGWWAETRRFFSPDETWRK